jgi:hypothetical protein
MIKIPTFLLKILAILFILLTVSCIARKKELSYELIYDTALSRENYKTPWPRLIIIAKSDETTPPPGLDFTPETYQLLREIDFDRNFLILWNRDCIVDSSTVKDIVRDNQTVIIRISPKVMHPGNIILPDWTWPYQLNLVRKDGEWDQDIKFIAEDTDGRILEDIVHFIP